MTVCAQGWSEMSRRTRIVRGLRVLLPLLALVILSTMFLFSRQSGTEPQIPYADVDAEEMAREPRMIAPEYVAVTEDGAELTLHADEAAPSGEGGSASRLALNWRARDGLVADLTAPQFGMAEGLISLSGGVHMATSSGWVVDAPRIDAATDRSRIAADEGVNATAPFGELSAGAMELVPVEAGGTGDEAAAGSILNFTGGVRLIYRP